MDPGGAVMNFPPQNERVIIRLPLPEGADSVAVQFYDDCCNEVGKLLELGLIGQTGVAVTALPVLSPEQIIKEICKEHGVDGEVDAEVDAFIRKTIQLARSGL